jgi:hexosaminidase
MDGSTPGLNSKTYTGALTITSSGIIKAAFLNNGRQLGRVYEKSFTIHKAVGKTVTLKNQPQGGFNPGNTFGLVNGILAVSFITMVNGMASAVMIWKR